LTITAEPEVAAPTPSAARRYARSFSAGAGAAVIAFAVMITNGTLDFGKRLPFGGDFYDAQAHSLLSGTFDMPASVVRLEGFRYHGHLVMYFAPFPALLRLPTAALTHTLDGRTGRVAMTVAFAIAMVGVGRLLWRIRRLVRGDAPLTRTEEWVTAAVAVVAGVGSSLFFLGSMPLVYHEAIIWAVAFALLAFDALLGWIERPRGRVLALASLFTLLSLMSRLAVGLGPSLVLGALVVAVLLRNWKPAARLERQLGLDLDGTDGRVAACLAAAVAVPLALYAVVNYVKLGTPFSVPYGRQVASSIAPDRPATLAANNGSLFNVKAIVTNLWAYVRPDAIGFRSALPWVGLPKSRPSVIGNLRYDMLDYTASLVTTMPAMIGFAVAGLVAIVRAPARVAVATARSLSLPVLAAALSVLPTLVIVYITPRYLSDFFPAIALAAIAGFHLFMRWAQSTSRSTWRRVVVGVVAVCAVWSCVANIGVARQYQQEHGDAFFSAPIAR
jgi:hypothetical protein